MYRWDLVRHPALMGILGLALCACGSSSNLPVTTADVVPATPRASCGPGSLPEPGMQGRVSAEDHANGRAAQGYRCNAELVGQFRKENAVGAVAGFKVERHVDAAGRECAYYDTTTIFPTNLFGGEAGVNVLDMSDPTQPRRTVQLLTPAMLSPHESLVLNTRRGVLAAVAGNLISAPGVVDLYDVSQDCRAPVLKASLPTGILGHESGMAPDGMTFYTASAGVGTIAAVDISDLSRPVPLWQGRYESHGLSISEDGNRAYVADLWQGLLILDVSEIQARKSNPQVREVARLDWPNRSIPQNAIPVTIKGKPYLVEIDEFAVNEEGDVTAHGPRVGAGRIIDISDETQPKVVSDLRLEVHQPGNRAAIANDPGAQNLTAGYAGHYCNVPSRVDPGIVACSMILSGLRVFDIRDPSRPREVAYFNPPVKPGGNAPLSSPAFVPERKEIWYSDTKHGFFAVRLTNDAWPD